MYHTEESENKYKLIAWAVSISFLGLILLILLLIIIRTPNPPFPPGGGGGEPLAFGTYIEGTGDVRGDGIGNATSVVVNEQPTPPANTKASEEVVTSAQGENVNLKNDKPKVENNNTVVIPVKPKEEVKPKTAAEIAREKFLKNQGKNAGSEGSSGHAGQEGAPDGKIGAHGEGGTGGGDGKGDGPGNGDGTGPGPGGPGKGHYGFSLVGRAIVTPPPASRDTKEEGKVVVEIVVDKTGKVIDANPNGRGTTTSSAILKAKARQAALATRFNVSGAFEEQRGTITIIFSF